MSAVPSNRSRKKWKIPADGRIRFWVKGSLFGMTMALVAMVLLCGRGAEGACEGGGPVFAVIPSVLVGGPLALLAMLFPAVFGGLFFFFRRWMAALTVISTVWTLYLLHGWLAPTHPTAWWAPPVVLGQTILGVLFLGVLWAWSRHLALVYRVGTVPSTEPNPLDGARLGEVIALVLGSGLLIGAAWLWGPSSWGARTPADSLMAVLAIGIWTVTIYLLYVGFVRSRWAGKKPALPGEGILLLAMLLASILLVASGGRMRSEESTASFEDVKGDSSIQKARVVWRFRPTEPCWIASSPAVRGERVYIGVVHGAAIRSGSLYCLDRANGKVVWSFNNEGQMLDSFSSPTVADGRVYIGEGFHQHAFCKLYCLDGATGAKQWSFETGSHTESTPCIAGGKVYFGAGDDGMYCLDAVSGKEVWHLNELHVDASPLVVDGRVYCGSGVGDVFRQTAVFCLDAETGKEVWRMPTDLPVWGGPALRSGRLYVGMGNGNLIESDARPAGAVLCLDASKGERIWRFDARDGVHTRMVTDAHQVYFGSRDQRCYAVRLDDGKKVWAADIGSPVSASPALAQCSHCGATTSVYVSGSYGKMCCLDPIDGRVLYTFDVFKDTQEDALLFSSPAVQVGQEGEGDRRQIFFGGGLSGASRGILYCVEDLLRHRAP